MPVPTPTAESPTRPRLLDRKRITVRAAILAISFVGLAFNTAPAGAADLPECTITGTPSADTLRGTSRDDVICGRGGNDTVFAGGGDDEVYGGPGADQISGGGGDDSAEGGPGNDRIGGDGGGDFLDGGSSPDRLSGGPGDDALMGGPGTDGINPGPGSDTCASDSADRISGACSVDITGPTIELLDFPSPIEAGGTLTATFALKDPSGVDAGSPNAKVGGAPGWITTWCGFPIMAELVSGSGTDGVWSVTCPVPTNAVNDPYALFFSAQDSFGNASWFDNAEFRVTGGSDDNRAPVVTDVVIPEGVEPGETVTITWRAADPSGVSGAYPWVYLPGPPWGVLYGPGIGAPVRTSGDATDGSYSQTFTLPENSPAGTYAVFISVRDELGNKTYEQYGSFIVG